MRLSIAFLVLASGAAGLLPGCTKPGPLIRVTVELHGFARGCVRVTAGRPGDPDPGSSEVLLDQARQSGLVSVAVFPRAEWGSSVEVAAQAREGDCAGPLANVDRKTVDVTPDPVDVRLSLAVDDADGDGFFALPRGTDCDDGDPGVHRGATEACNGRDDNCDGAVDEGFDVGLSCAAGSCVGANACNADGTRRCDPDVQWYPDQDGDERGRADATGVTSCMSPGAGMAPNRLDCNDGDPAVYAGARELCDGKDNDCSGNADEPFFLGQSCQGSACSGSYGCSGDGGVQCTGGEGTLGFPDIDRDAFGANGSSGTILCGAIPSGFSAAIGDCDDGDDRIHPGAADLCDTLDNDCSGTADDGFPGAGAPCDAGAGCAGATIACLADGGAGCVVFGHQDLDRDQHGAMAGATVTGCFLPDSGWIYNATDCDDLDPFTFQGAPEICDLKDNNCSGAADEGACPADAGWYAKTDGDAGHDFQTVVSSLPGGAIAAGANASVVVVEPAAPVYTDHTGECGTQNWAASWFDPVTDRFFLAGAGGNCQVHGRTAPTCVMTFPCVLSTTPTANVRGLVGFRGPGTVESTGLDIIGVMENGQTFVWDGTVTGDDHSLGSVTAQLRGVHGASRTRVFAVGTDTPMMEPRIFRYPGTGTTWTNQNVQSLPGVVHAPLNAVWMASDSLGYAVGEQRSMLTWNGTAWSVMAGPTGGSGSLRGVVAWSPTLVFVADDKIHKWDGTQWTTLSAGFGAQIFGLGGSSPGDLWAVGADGWIVHWPKAPY
ncbi:MAG TPA: putative metal-binding motif-containing protein [Myxococcaceae bacterium]|jgi:hypothetical protein